MTPEITQAVACRDELGECPVWDPQSERLYWTDITGPTLCWYEPKTKRTHSWKLPKPIGSFALRQGGGMIVAMRANLATFDETTGAVTTIEGAVDLGDTRFNDGKCDRLGRFWVGTLDRHMRPDQAALYRVDPGFKVTRKDGPFTLGNGLGWSPDDKTMYFTDTRNFVIYAYDYDLARGEIANRRAFVRFDRQSTTRPDGLCVDSQGFVWVAMVHGWNVTRFDPTGKVERRIDLPVERPTSCAFGGPDLDVLYVTTSTLTLEPEALAKQPLAGSLLAVRTGITGLADPRFAG